MHSLKKRLEIESQIHKADNLQIMTDNMALIDMIGKVRLKISKLNTDRTDAENDYKQMCTKYGIKPARNLEDLKDPEWQKENANVLRNLKNPSKTEDDETLQNLRRMREHRRNHIEMLKQSVEEARLETMQLE